MITDHEADDREPNFYTRFEQLREVCSEEVLFLSKEIDDMISTLYNDIVPVIEEIEIHLSKLLK